MEKQGKLKMMRGLLFRSASGRRGRPSLLQAFGKDRRGIAAVEFALVLPILVVLFIGTVEISAALTVDRKLSQAASAVADLVAQESNITQAELNDVMDIARSTFDPYPSNEVHLVVAGVLMEDDYKPRVQWSEGLNAAKWAKGAAPPIVIPNELTKSKDTFLVVTHATYTYRPTFVNLFKDIFSTSQIELEDQYYLRPRISAQVACCS
ncbi:pilus assembly protein [Stappia sp. F7233]|uniref:Pilus assembly protein n=1 Tax=Stappia albiluteola TaxID=2758565 RepID=A0A839AB22_9HYPH|nr:TadE/TadG family type IV pilus assembly protein [Stappia albiluteola]MBA5776238.1 pilus assembly protein [Stappia albiluteola]